MKYAFAQVVFGLSANALVARESSQCIHLQASGGASGVFGQLSDGQNRVGGVHPTGCYCLSSGGLTDTNGRGCILTPPTTQFQCDVGASPTGGFAIGSDGQVNYDGNERFYACPVNDNDEYNIYTQPVSGQNKCVEISLSSAGSCGSGSAPAKSSNAAQPSKPAQSSKSVPNQPAQPSKSAQSSRPAKPSQSAQSSPPAPQAPQPAQPSQPSQSAPQSSQPAQPSKPASSQPAPEPSKPSGACPTDLNGNYEYPHLIVPVSSQQPSKSYGTSYFGTVNSTTCSIFNFDVPASYSGKTCTLLFLFPEQKDLETSSYTVSGNGKVDFSKLKGPASQQTTWANQPGKESELQSLSVAPGNSYAIASDSCAASQTVTYELCSQGDFALNYFQDYNPSPIGLYIRSC